MLSRQEKEQIAIEFFSLVSGMTAEEFRRSIEEYKQLRGLSTETEQYMTDMYNAR